MTKSEISCKKLMCACSVAFVIQYYQIKGRIEGNRPRREEVKGGSRIVCKAPAVNFVNR